LTFRVETLVISPDHIHTIWTLPLDNCDYSKPWGIIGKYFAQPWLALDGAEQAITTSRLRSDRKFAHWFEVPPWISLA
jgi:putative transposase